MRKLLLFIKITVFLFSTSVIAQNGSVPELIYYQFNTGTTTVQNIASSPVGNNPATISGLTTGSGGFLGTNGLIGNGNSSSTDIINTGWNTTMNGDFTIAFWTSSVPSSTTLFYIFGDAGASSFRCFTNGVAGANNWMVRGPFPDVLLPGGETMNPSMMHVVYDATAGTVTGYVDGVQVSQVAATGLSVVGTGLTVGGYTTSSSLSGVLDEFRWYNRALSPQEINDTYNKELPLTRGSDDIGVVSIDDPTPGTCAGNTPITITVSNFGTNQVDTFSVAWELNGVPQTPQTYYTLLDTNGGVNPTSTQITLNPSYNFAAPTNLKFWTFNPNNVTDTINQNDTLQTTLSPALAGIYTIGSGGDYANFTAAVNDLSSLGICAPVTFNVLSGSGPFNEQIEIPQIVGSSATNTITFNGNGETITYSTTGTADNYIIRLNGADYITIDSLNIVTQSATNNFAIQLTNDADFNTINNCNIDLTSTLSSTLSSNAGIVVSGSLTSATTAGASGSNNTFTNNTITGGYYGITINGASSTNESMSNTITGNTIQDFYYYGAYLRSISNSVISNNDIHRMNRLTVNNFYAMYFVTSGSRNLIEANEIHDAYTGTITSSTNTSYPIYHTGVDAALGDENRVVNNLIYNINNNGTLYAFYNSSSNGVHYLHNTISLDDPNATGGDTRGLYQTLTASNIEFKNNIISITRGGTGSKYCIYLATTGSTITSNNNVFYMNAPAGTNNLGYSGGDQATLLDWQTATSGDANSIADDPIFANPSSAQFAPTNAGINGIADASVNVTTDFYGVTRAATPDPGAIEFTPPACPQPSSLAAINVTGSTVDLSWTENGTATLWDIEWDTAGFTPTGIPTITGTTNNPQQITGLTPLTDYEFYVRSVCGVNDTSLWSGPYLFTTGCATQLSGTYTIGTTGNYLTFTDAVNEMITCGISGPVVFNVLSGSGPFNEQITIPPILGASGVNTITFNGNGEVITSTTTSSTRSIILLDGADHITFDSLVVQTQSSTNNFAIQLINDADSNTINNCVVDLTSALSSTLSSNAGIVVSGSLTSATTTGASGAYNTITNNHIIGGYYGITINGASSTNESYGNIVNNNRIEDFYYYGAYLRSISNSSISFNDISRPTRTSTSSFTVCIL